MKHILIFLVAVIIPDCYHYGALASPTSTVVTEEKSESGSDGNNNLKSIKRRVFTSSASSSSGPAVWKTTFSGPETGGSVVSFSNVPFSSKSEVHKSKTESTSSGTKKIESHIITSPDDSQSVFSHTGIFDSEEDEDIMPSKSIAQAMANAGFRTRMLGLGGSESSSGLLGLGFGLL